MNSVLFRVQKELTWLYRVHRFMLNQLRPNLGNRECILEAIGMVLGGKIEVERGFILSGV